MEVIRIGRRRTAADSRIACVHAAAFIAQLVGELHDQDAVLGRQPDQHDDADLAEEVERAAGDAQAEQRAEHAQRHGQHDHQRMDEALELRGQHQVHDQQRQAEGEQHRATRLQVFARFALPVDLRVLGQFLGGHLLRPRHRLAQRIARRQPGGNGDRTQPVEAVEAAGLGHFAERDQVGQRHQFAAAGAHLDRGQVGRGLARLALGLDDHVVFLAVVDVGRDPARAHHRLQRAADIGDRYAQVGGACAIDVDPHLRAGFLVVGIRPDQARVIRHARQQLVAPLRDFGVIRSAQHDLELLATGAHQAAADLGARTHAGQGRQLLCRPSATSAVLRRACPSPAGTR